MRSIRHLVGMVVVCGSLLLAFAEASGEALGTFRWRFAPFCNVVTLTIIQEGPALSVSGFDDDCGFTLGSPASGTLFVAPNGVVTGTLTIINAQGFAVNTWIQMSAGSGSGNWNDNFDNQGSFIMNPATAPGVQRPLGREAWAYVESNGGLFDSSGNLTVSHPATGEYCVVIAKRDSHKAAQVTLADPGGSKIVSVGTGHGSKCNPLDTATHDAVPVFIRTPAGAAVDGNFTIVIPLR